MFHTTTSVLCHRITARDCSGRTALAGHGLHEPIARVESQSTPGKKRALRRDSWTNKGRVVAVMLSPTESESLRDNTCRLLWEAGMKIENERIRSAMLETGCQQAPSGRIRIPAKLVEEMAACQKRTQEEDRCDQELHLRCGIDWAHHVIWHNKQEEMRRALEGRLLMSAFDCGPTTYYDYANERLVPVDTGVFITAKKFAQATPEIGYTSTWYRHDVPPSTERIDSLVLALKHTDKVDGIEAIDPPLIKYLKEISEIITERPGDSSYLAGSECITSPLILERRSAEDIVERKARGIHRYHVASMPTIGVSKTRLAPNCSCSPLVTPKIPP